MGSAVEEALSSHTPARPSVPEPPPAFQAGVALALNLGFYLLSQDRDFERCGWVLWGLLLALLNALVYDMAFGLLAVPKEAEEGGEGAEGQREA